MFPLVDFIWQYWMPLMCGLIAAGAALGAALSDDGDRLDWPREEQP